MIVSIHQPQYLPWLPYFVKLLHSDVFVIFDAVQYPRGRNLGNRNQVKTANGVVWLTVPVLSRGDMLPYRDIRVDDKQRWANKHWKTIEVAYTASPHFHSYSAGIRELYLDRQWGHLVDLNEAFLRFGCAALGIRTRIIRASSLKAVRSELDTAGYIMAILKELGADGYISGQGAGSQRYVDAGFFAGQGVRLMGWECSLPEYRQRWGGFVPNLSFIDTLLNCGSQAGELLRQHGRVVTPTFV